MARKSKLHGRHEEPAESRKRWAAAAKSALEINQEKLGPPDGPLGDFIRLIKLRLHFMDPKPPVRRVVWKDGWGLRLEDLEAEN